MDITSTDASKTTAQNGVDICESSAVVQRLRLKTGSVLQFLLEIKLQLKIFTFMRTIVMRRRKLQPSY